jgi:hypothetical protein
MRRRHHADQQFRIEQGLTQIATRRNAGRNLLARKKHFIYAAGRDGLADFFSVRPQADLVSFFSSQHNREGGAPRARANDGYAAHPRLN